MKKRILIVDDEADFTTMLRHTLATQGYYEVQEENNAAAARQTARFFDPDLIILDIHDAGNRRERTGRFLQG
jgi:DNA-binding response OmpR family regulator